MSSGTYGRLLANHGQASRSMLSRFLRGPCHTVPNDAAARSPLHRHGTSHTNLDVATRQCCKACLSHAIPS